MIFTLITQALAIGENCAAPITRWDKAYCEIASQPEKFQTGCYPQRAFPSNANNYGNVANVKGFLVLYHGYTACPDAFEGIVQELTKQGYVTVTPLLPGQGIKLGYGCATPGVCLQPLGTNPSFLIFGS
jgi:hypothetical protein